MAFKETLQLVIQGDNRGAVKAVREVGQVSTTEFNKSQKRIDQWGKGLTKAGIGMASFGAAALVGLGALAKQSEEANLAQVKLDNTLANMPKLAGENAKQFTDLATKIQGYSAADADAIIAGEAMLGTFNLTADQIKGITPLVVDFSRKFGVDMVTASTMVGKALDGNVGALKRNGVSIDETAFKTDRYGAVQKALSDQVGGFARAEGATFAGSLERMKNQLGDLAEGVGGGAVDAFTMMFGAVGKAAGALERISPGAQNAAGKIATFSAVGLVAVGGLSTLVGKAIEARENFGRLAGGLSSLTGKLGGLGNVARSAASIAGVAGLAIAAKELGDALSQPHTIAGISELENKLLDFSQTGRASGAAAKVLGKDMGDLSEALHRITEPSVSQRLGSISSEIPLIGGDTKGIRQAKERIDELDKALASLAAKDPSAAADAFKQINDAMVSQGTSAKDVRAQFNDYRAAVADADTANRTTKGSIDETSGALDGETEAANAAAEAIKAKTDAELAAIDPLFAMQDALQGNIDAQADVKTKQLEATAAQNAYSEAVAKFGPKSKEATDAYFAMIEAQSASVDADRKAVRSVEDVERATADLRAEIKKNPAALDNAKAKLREWQRQGYITAGQARKTAREFDGLAGSINRTPRAKTIRVRQVGAEGAKIKILQVVDAMGRLHNKTLTIGVTTALGAQAVGLMESKMFRAAGGPVRANKAYVVGESGPELFLPDTGGMIIPNKQMAGGAMGGWGGAGGKVQVELRISGSGRLAQEIHYGVRRGDIQLFADGKRVSAG